MPSYSTNEFKGGLKIMLDGAPCNIITNEVVKPGKGQAFNRVKIKNLITGKTWDKTFKSGESVEAADVLDVDMQYLYADDANLHFMDVNTYEQLEVAKNVAEEALRWIKEQDPCQLTLWNGQAISVLPPNFVNLKIIETDPGVRGDTSGGGNKPAKLETGATVRVPLFVQQDEVIKVDTRTGEYVSRA